MSDINKIEDVFDDVKTTLDFNGKKDDPVMPMPEPEDLSFSRVLDFAFPKQIRESNFVQIGQIIYVGDGVVHITGLDKAMVEEIVDIQTQLGIEKALILGIQESKVEAVVMGDYSKIKRGDQVKSTGSKLKVPVGPELLGRVIDPLGRPIDGKGPIKSTGFRDVEFPAPSVMERRPIFEPLHTGVMVVDTTIPVGRGQRELVVGDRKSGKSRTMIDIISNQKGSDIFCVYVGIGMQAAKAKATVETLEQRGAMDFTTVVVALADQPPSLQYMSPYVGSAVAEHYMYNGQHALIVYDDLSKQAKAYRQVSLLLKRSPGRDAYPGDIFFLHSRLLERASRLNDKTGGGSITALPVAETQQGDVSDYIITNLMSITDGHIYLDVNLMNEGILPAVNSGLSVSRIGGKVQTPMLRKVGELAGRTLARYNEVKSFETINTEIAEETLRDIKRGKRVREILAQDSSLNLSPDEQIVLLAIATSSRMDHLELEDAVTFKQNIIPFYRDMDMTEFKKLSEKTKEMKELDPYLDELWEKFSKKFNFAKVEKTAKKK